MNKLLALSLFIGVYASAMQEGDVQPDSEAAGDIVLDMCYTPDGERMYLVSCADHLKRVKSRGQEVMTCHKYGNERHLECLDNGTLVVNNRAFQSRATLLRFDSCIAQISPVAGVCASGDTTYSVDPKGAVKVFDTCLQMSRGPKLAAGTSRTTYCRNAWRDKICLKDFSWSDSPQYLRLYDLQTGQEAQELPLDALNAFSRAEVVPPQESVLVCDLKRICVLDLRTSQVVAQSALDTPLTFGMFKSTVAAYLLANRGSSPLFSVGYTGSFEERSVVELRDIRKLSDTVACGRSRLGYAWAADMKPDGSEVTFLGDAGEHVVSFGSSEERCTDQ